MEEQILNLLSGFIGIIIGFISSALLLRYNYHQLFATTVSSNRMDWINVWRQNLSKFISCAEIIHTTLETQDNKEKLLEYKKEMLEARAMIITRLNTKELNHVLIYGLLTKLDCSPSNSNFYSQQVEIIELAHKILKLEWERVKSEAKGKKNNG